MVYNIYLDTCIFIAYYNSNDRENQRKEALNFLKTVANKKEVKLFASSFTFSEFIKTMADKKISQGKLFTYFEQLNVKNKIGGKYKFTLINPKIKEDEDGKSYGFDDFFMEILEIQLDTSPRPHLADTIHATIMKNNDLKNIITFNINDFKMIDSIRAFTPNNALIQIEKKQKKEKKITADIIIRANKKH